MPRGALRRPETMLVLAWGQKKGLSWVMLHSQEINLHFKKSGGKVHKPHPKSPMFPRTQSLDEQRCRWGQWNPPENSKSTLVSSLMRIKNRKKTLKNQSISVHWVPNEKPSRPKQKTDETKFEFEKSKMIDEAWVWYSSVYTSGGFDQRALYWPWYQLPTCWFPAKTCNHGREKSVFPIVHHQTDSAQKRHKPSLVKW